VGAVEFFSKVIGAIVWPLTLVVLLLVFRSGVQKILDQMAERVKTMTSFRGPAGVGADFDSRVLDVREDARALSAAAQQQEPQEQREPQDRPPVIDSVDLSEIEDFDVENLAIRAENFPRSVIIESWLYLEEELQDAGRSFGIPEADRRTVGTLLRQLAVRSPQVANTLPVIRELQDLRNQAAHNRRMALSPLAAYDYAVTALRLALLIKKMPIPEE
jgi:hypothetical protein